MFSNPTRYHFQISDLIVFSVAGNLFLLDCIIVTEFWKITHMVAPETIRIFELSMALLIAENTFKNISKLYL